jgi:hypothetical protein
MNTKRNIGIIGSPNSEASEVFEAVLRFDQTPKPEANMSWEEFLAALKYEPEPAKPYDAKKRKKLFGKD